MTNESPNEESDDEVVIWYRPRVRSWLDQHGELHLAGEPDGLVRVLDALRLVVRGIEEEAAVALRTDPIEEHRNPVHGHGVKQLFEKIVVRRDRKASLLRAELGNVSWWCT